LQDFEHHRQCEVCSDVPLDFYTCWIPLRDCRLQLIPGSHRIEGYCTPSSAGDSELLPGEYDATSQSWHTLSSVHDGDVVIFNWRTIYKRVAGESAEFRFCINSSSRQPAPPH